MATSTFCPWENQKFFASAYSWLILLMYACAASDALAPLTPWSMKARTTWSPIAASIRVGSSTGSSRCVAARVAHGASSSIGTSTRCLPASEPMLLTPWGA